MSVYGSYYQLRAEKHLYELDGNDKQLYFTNVKIISLMEDHPGQFGSSVSNRVYAYYHLGKTALKIGLDSEAKNAVNRIRALKATGEIANYDRENFALSLEIDISLAKRDFKTALAFLPEAEKLFLNTAYSNEMVKEEHRKFYCYQFALAEFWLGNYPKAMKIVSQITSKPESARMFKDLLANAYRLELLALMAQSKWDELERLCGIATEFWKSEQLFNQLEASFSQIMRRLIKTQGQNLTLDLSKWLNELVLILNDPMEKRSLDNFDLVGWLQAFLSSYEFQQKDVVMRSKSA